MGVRTLVWMTASLALALLVSLGATGPAHADALDDLVARFYSDVLDRPPEPAGAAAWSGFLRDNCNAFGFDTLARNFFGSDEFVQTKSLTLDQLVTKFYLALLDRQPEPAGAAAWADVLRQTRVRIALSGFVPSPEFRGLLPDRTDRAAVTSVVTRLYTEILQRQPEPEGLTTWVDFIVQTGNLEAVAQGFLTSAEFESRPLTFPGYVTILYNTFLRRSPDPVGLNGWVRIMTESMLVVINAGFIPSPEFQGLSAALCPNVIPTIVGTYSGTLTLTQTMCTVDPSDNTTFLIPLIISIIGQSAGQFSGSGSVVANMGGVNVAIATMTLSGTVTGGGGVAGSFDLVFNPPVLRILGNFNGSVVGKTLSLNVATQDIVGDTCRGTGTYVGTRP